VILSRKRIDNDGPKSACQSANFQMTQLLNWLGRFQPRELHKHLHIRIDYLYHSCKAQHAGTFRGSHSSKAVTKMSPNPSPTL